MTPHNKTQRGLFLRSRGRGGLTLIELVVVVALLSAVATMISRMGPGLVRQSASAVGGASLMDLMRAIERHRTVHGRFPDGYDSLIEAPYTLYSGIPDRARRQLKPKDLDNADRLVLRANGITTTWMHSLPLQEPVTWQAMSAAKAFDATAGGFAADDVAALDTTRIDPDRLFGRGTRKGTVNESFMVFGVGNRCTLVGSELAQAPVGVPTSAVTSPQRRYLRLALVFRLDRDDRIPFRFLGAVGFTDAGIVTGSELAQEWWRPN
jgi:prepilin-type N-terminal cleavage/methylation domain-containing protein